MVRVRRFDNGKGHYGLTHLVLKMPNEGTLIILTVLV